MPVTWSTICPDVISFAFSSRSGISFGSPSSLVLDEHGLIMKFNDQNPPGRRRRMYARSADYEA